VGISHSYGSANVRNVLFDTIDVERNSMTNLGRSWARFVIDPRKAGGGSGGGVYDVRIRNINVRDAGTDAVPVIGLSDDKAVENLVFENIRMPGRPAAASKRADGGVPDPRCAPGVTVEHRSNGAPASGG